jgi:hypothetical protein
LADASASGSAPSPGGGPGNAMPANLRSGPMSAADRAAFVRERQMGRGGMSAGNPNFNNGGNSALQSAGMGSTYQQSGTPQTEQDIEDQAMSVAKQMAQIEQNRIALQPAVDQGMLPPLPPTMLTPGESTGIGGAPLLTSPSGTPVSPTLKR